MKRTPGGTTAERVEYWTRVIEEARRYPTGITAFCRDKGISHENYYSWFRRLRTEHPEWSDLMKDSVHMAKQAKAKRQAQIPRQSGEVEEKPQRRKFSAKQKLRILSETDAAAAGDVAAILRREGIYSSTLQKWREQRKADSLEEKKRGRKHDADAARVKMLEAKVAQLERKLKHKDALLGLQKKIAEILETTKDQGES